MNVREGTAPRRSSRVALLLPLLLLCAVASGQSPEMRFRLPKTQPPRLYGTILISRSSAAGDTKAVVFPHWNHRARYTCRVCHVELDFALRTNDTEITEQANREGAYCGACHDGRIAFAVSEASNCARCHTGTIDGSDAGFGALLDLPGAEFGNRVDWSRALALGTIKPVASLTDEAAPIRLDKTLSLEAEWSFVPPAVFPHAEHERWTDCSSCHPAIFNIGKKTTAHFTMASSLRGEFCGVCHLRVAFPMNDCKRCHPSMKNPPPL
jgi:c(7)-type cytochrome triheme protein